MTIRDIREAYLDFFKARNHVVIPSSPLVPENDPTTLFVSSGMQPLLPYFLGEPHPKGTRVVNSQLSFRASDIEEIGDNRHTTTFEMLGNWSFGDYFKKEQITWLYEFLDTRLHIPMSKLWVTCFEGDASMGLPRDEESANLWKSLGIHESRIRFYGAAKNWWSRSGEPSHMPPGEPGGTDTEVFYDFGTPHNPAFGIDCHPNCDCGRFMEIGNSVFMEYQKQTGGAFSKLPKQNVDFGGGLERLAAAVIDTPDIFKIYTLWATIDALQQKTGAVYDHPTLTRSFRIVADHLRGAVFMIGEGVEPSNTEQGYILRRLIRRAVQHTDRISAQSVSLMELVDTVVEPYKIWYPRLEENRARIKRVISEEETRFRKTLKEGLKEFEKGADPFILFTTYGFPIELTIELAKECGNTVDVERFNAQMEEHQKLSRVGSEHKFKGGLADASEKTTMLHTATHLMLAGLRTFLGEHVHQAGSNITQERTRFDFTHPDKVSREILNKVEAYVNEAIGKKATVEIIQMPKEEAKAAGVEGSFWEKYPDVVNVYQVRALDGTVYSKELCGGPHVENTGSIVGTFKIIKEEASSFGIRRIKAVLE